MKKRAVSTVYLALGSNVGNRHHNIRCAIRLLAQHAIAVKKTSAVIETDPVGGPAQRKFLNAALKGETALIPAELLQQIKKIEKVLGRKKTVKNGPRTIDIDILLYGRKKITTPRLTIPHPRMRERTFVMQPLAEIAPRFKKSSVRVS